MLKCQKNKFWLENISNLLCSSYLIPLDGMSLADQLNAVTRSILIISIILFIFNFKFAYLFLLLSILFIIILYYIQKSQMNKIKAENFKLMAQPMASKQPHSELSSARVQWVLNKTRNPTLGHVKSIYNPPRRFCDDEVPLEYNPGLVRRNKPNINPGGAFNNPNYISKSQRLVGGPNPKTLIAPVITPKSHDMDYWRANNLVNHSSINSESQIDNYQSGYKVSNSCFNNTVVENFANPYRGIPPKGIPPPRGIQQPYIKHEPQSSCVSQLYPVREGFEEADALILNNEPGWVNTACGYNPEQLFDSGLPTNLPAGNCTQDPVMKKYNENLFTQTVQPGVYTTSQINQPINSNMGISFTQQFPPTSRSVNPNTGSLNFTERDPRIIEPIMEELPVYDGAIANESNINDPRFSGYGTSYRSYTDDKLGQTRFYYDDIDAIRMPNYITRSNIDNQPFADHYGPLQPGASNGNIQNSNIKELANKAFLDNSLLFRTEMQERLMRKANSNAWQNRSAPKRTGGQRMMGMGRIF